MAPDSDGIRWWRVWERALPRAHQLGSGIAAAADSGPPLSPTAAPAQALPPPPQTMLHYLASPLAKAVLVSTASSVLSGYDQGVIAAAMLTMRDDLSLDNVEQELAIGIMNIAAAGGGLLAGLAAERFGRKKAIALANVFFLLGSAAIAMADSFMLLFVGRLLQGVGVGFALVVAPIFTAELVPAEARGRLVSLGDVCTNGGILLGYSVGLLFLDTPYGWRYMFWLGCAPALLIVASIWTAPESPRWLVSVGRIEEARRVVHRLHTDDAEAAASLDEMVAAVALLKQQTDAAGTKSGWLDVFWHPDKIVRWMIWRGLAIALFSQLTGTEAVASFSLGFSPLVYVICSELFPLGSRARAMSCALFITRVTAGTISSSFISLREALTPTGAWLLFVPVAVGAFGFVYHFIPETNGLGLEEVHDMFSKIAERKAARRRHAGRGGHADEWGGGMPPAVGGPSPEPSWHDAAPVVEMLSVVPTRSSSRTPTPPLNKTPPGSATSLDAITPKVNGHSAGGDGGGDDSGNGSGSGGGDGGGGADLPALPPVYVSSSSGGSGAAAAGEPRLAASWHDVAPAPTCSGSAEEGTTKPNPSSSDLYAPGAVERSSANGKGGGGGAPSGNGFDEGGGGWDMVSAPGEEANGSSAAALLGRPLNAPPSFASDDPAASD
ncbi:hypothetical protein T492DRAFT_944975 [Pavlovales sp. CCMP2436]|nr:hypothetical protein T492DRAFT_944975 [Pavlovales sp. CCMP2436]